MQIHDRLFFRINRNDVRLFNCHHYGGVLSLIQPEEEHLELARDDSGEINVEYYPTPGRYNFIRVGEHVQSNNTKTCVRYRVVAHNGLA